MLIGDCSLNEDRRSCDLQTDNRDCSLQVDNRDCSANEDRRDCSTWTGINDPICETAKAFQNALYAGQRQHARHPRPRRTACMLRRRQLVKYPNQRKTDCTLRKNSIAKRVRLVRTRFMLVERRSVRPARAEAKLSAKRTKAAEYQLCRLGNLYSGDLMGPESVAMYRRGIDENPLIPSIENFTTLIGHSELGDAESLANTGIRIIKSSDPDDTGDD